MFDFGLFLTCQAISRQLAAMPNEFYLIRLIHFLTRRAASGCPWARAFMSAPTCYKAAIQLP
jgi:hypothetical protein